MTTDRKPINRGLAGCPACGRKWRSETQCHCATCHAHFSSPYTFDLHLRGERHVRPEDVRDRNGYRLLKLVEKAGAGGSVWVTHREAKQGPADDEEAVA